MEDYEKLYKSKEITNVEYAKAVFGEKVLDKNYGMGIIYRALHLEKEEYFKSAKLSTLSELIKKYSLDIGPQELNKILLKKGIVKEIYANPNSKSPRKVAVNTKYCKNVSGKSFPLFYEGTFLEMIKEVEDEF